jgi:hypothetical protein
MSYQHPVERFVVRAGEPGHKMAGGHLGETVGQLNSPDSCVQRYQAVSDALAVSSLPGIFSDPINTPTLVGSDDNSVIA